MTSMIERCALAIVNLKRATHNIPPCRWEHLTDEGRAEYVGYARVAIEAMREPTAEMEQAYYAACDENGVCLWKHAYRTMIDAALKEQP